ncbi:MAG: peptidoglycan DD-metalloendopeptidase family protein [Acutalibacteraceae bacterium]
MQKYVRILSGIISMAILGMAFNFCNFENGVAAEDKVSSMRSQINQLEQQQKDLNSKLASLKNDINNKKTYRTTILEQMNSLQSQINVETDKIDVLNQEIASKQAQIDEGQQSMNTNMVALGERLKAIYKAGDVPELAIFLNVKNFDDLLDKADMIQKLSKYDAELIEELKEGMSKIKQEQEAIEKNKSEIESAKAILDAKRQELDALQQENERVIRELQSEESSIRNKINSNEARKRSLQSKISKSGRSQTSTLGYKKGRYMWPVPGHGKVSSGWGDGRGHNGIDIPAPKGTKIVTAADGVIVATNSSNSWGSGWGYYVKISHGDGYETMYAHLSQVSVSPGQSVKAGQIIGNMGSTGRSTGSHLHFGTSKNGKWYNPRTEI